MKSLALLLLLVSPSVVLGQRRQRVSRDGTCAGETGYTCQGSIWGNCCSLYGYCGKTSDYCGTGCNRSFGTCSERGPVSSVRTPTTSSRRTTSTPTSTRAATASPSATQRVTTNARCGPSFGGRSCLGSQWGDCCSQYSYCGSNIDYCDAKTCQQGFGKCNSGGSSSSRTVSPTTTTFSQPASSSSSASLSPSSSTSVTTSDVATSTITSTSSEQPDTVSSSATSTSSPAAPSCTCEPFTGDGFIAASCPSTNNQCQNGYQVLCDQEVYVGDEIPTPNIDNGNPPVQVCIDACTADPTCIVAEFSEYRPPMPQGAVLSSCSLWRGVTSYRSAFPAPGTFYGHVFKKEKEVCDPSTPPVTSSSATSSLEPPTATSPTLTTEVPSSSTSSSASAPTCAYSPAPNCEPFAGGLDGSCPGNNNKCTEGYQVLCGQSIRSGNTHSFGEIRDLTLQECIGYCNDLSDCREVAFEYYSRIYFGEPDVITLCNLWSGVADYTAMTSTPEHYYNVYRKVCTTDLPEERVSSIQGTPTPSETSTTLATVTTNPTPSDPPAPTCAPVTVPTTCESVGALGIIGDDAYGSIGEDFDPEVMTAPCPSQENRCISYRKVCDERILGSHWMVPEIFDITAEQCLDGCTTEPSCVGAAHKPHYSGRDWCRHFLRIDVEPDFGFPMGQTSELYVKFCT